MVERHAEHTEPAIHLKRAYDRQDDFADNDAKRAKNIKIEITGWMDLVRRYPKQPTLQTYLADAYSRYQHIAEEMEGWRILLNNHPTEQDLRDRLY